MTRARHAGSPAIGRMAAAAGSVTGRICLALLLLLCLSPLAASPLAAEEAAEMPPSEAVSDALDDDYDPLLDDDEFEDELGDGSDADPWESTNRGVFSFNSFLDDWVFDPVTDAYQAIFPEMFREGVNNVFLNLQSPVLIVNHLLQLRGKEAVETAGRFLINSSAGMGGFFDAADRGAGITRVDADFGQTLAAWGTPPGPFLMLPILGPSTLRDVTGDIVDRGMDPLTYLIGPIQWWIPIGLSQGLAVRDANIEELNHLEDAALDFYAALRSAYLQSREAAVREALAQWAPAGSDPVADEGAK